MTALRSVPPIPPRPLPATIGRYRIEAMIGKGGMGEVYKAFDPSLDRTVALKTIAPESENPDFLDRLYREARAVGRLRHPRIVTIYDLGETDGVVFIAMEHLVGDNLAAVLNRGELGFEQKINVLIQILDALQYAHSEGVVHRDIKPSNVHVMPDMSVKLLDFGLARVARANSLTASGAVMGTPFYMSPEQLKGQRVDGRTDIYSTGVVAYEMFTHRRAFDGENISSVMLRVLSEVAPPMATALSSTFPEIERIVTRAMAKSADDRYATAEDMRNAFAAFLASSHEAIVNAQAEITVYARRAVIEAKTLIAKGRIAESETLLAATLAANPDAKEVRQLLQEAAQPLARTSAPPPGPGVVAPVVPVPKVEAPSAPPPVPRFDPAPPVVARAAAEDAERPAPPPVAQYPKPTPSRQAPRKSEPSPRRRRLWWLAPAAAVVGLSVVVIVMAQRSQAPAADSRRLATAALAETTVAAPSPTSVPPTTPVGSGLAANATATPGQTVPAAPTASSTAATPAAAQAQTQMPAQPGAPVNQRGRTQPAGGGQRGAATRESRGVYVNTANTDAALRAPLAEALSARMLTEAQNVSAAQVEISARTQVSVRPSPFNGNSAMTGDYVTTLQIHNVATGARRSIQLDGHALEFGESVVRQAALKRAAEQIAEAIDMELGK